MRYTSAAEKATPADEFGVRHQAGDQRSDGRGAEQHGLGQPARAQQAVGKHVAALGIGGELDLVDGDELDPVVKRHRLGGAHEIARPRRHDALLAGDQCHLPGAARRRNAVVDLAREQAQGAADHAGAVAEHALDRKMRLAGVGGSENRGQPAGLGGRCAGATERVHRPNPRRWRR
jgi:hypothetical protein